MKEEGKERMKSGIGSDSSGGRGKKKTLGAVEPRVLGETTTPETPGSQAWGDDAAGTPGYGLPLNVVAVQIGQTP